MSIDVNLANYLFGEVKSHLLEKRGINPPKELVGVNPSRYTGAQKKQAADWLKKGSVDELKKYHEKLSSAGTKEANAMKKLVSKAIKQRSRKKGIVKRVMDIFKKKKAKSKTVGIIKQLKKNPDVKDPQALAGYIRHYVKTGLRKPGKGI